MLDAERGERLPEVAEVDAAHLQHGVGAWEDPAHAGAFHTILDHTPAGPFDDAGGDRETVFEAGVTGHATGVVV